MSKILRILLRLGYIGLELGLYILGIFTLNYILQLLINN